jgi:hypothetical protein
MVVRTGQQLQQIAAIYKSDWLQGTHSEKKNEKKKCYPSSAFFSATSPEREKESEREREREGALLGTFHTGGLGRRLRTDF